MFLVSPVKTSFLSFIYPGAGTVVNLLLLKGSMSGVMDLITGLSDPVTEERDPMSGSSNSMNEPRNPMREYKTVKKVKTLPWTLLLSVRVKNCMFNTCFYWLNLVRVMNIGGSK